MSDCCKIEGKNEKNKIGDKMDKEESNSKWPIYLFGIGTVLLLVFSVFQYSKISSLENSIGSSTSLQGDSSQSGGQTDSYAEMLKQMHPEQYQQYMQAKAQGGQSSAPAQVGGC